MKKQVYAKNKYYVEKDKYERKKQVLCENKCNMITEALHDKKKTIMWKNDKHYYEVYELWNKNNYLRKKMEQVQSVQNKYM